MNGDILEFDPALGEQFKAAMLEMSDAWAYLIQTDSKHGWAVLTQNEGKHHIVFPSANVMRQVAGMLFLAAEKWEAGKLGKLPPP